MHVVFLDPAHPAYEPDAPGVRMPAVVLCRALAQRGHQIRFVNGIAQERRVAGVDWLPRAGVSRTLLSDGEAVVVIDGPQHAFRVVRPLMAANAPLILWSERCPAVLDGWDAHVVSTETDAERWEQVFVRVTGSRRDNRAAGAAFRRGVAMHREGALQQALAEFDVAVERAPDWAAAHGNRGVILKDLGRHGDAIRACERALALRPQLSSAANCLGAVFNLQGDVALAETWWRRALELDAANVEAAINLAHLLAASGRAGAALELLEQNSSQVAARTEGAALLGELRAWRGAGA